MDELVQITFRNTIDTLHAELDKMPFSVWSESILRWFFCRSLAYQYNDVQTFVECDKIDLVLRRAADAAFIEFKFYRHARKFDPYSGLICGWKGGPSPKNRLDFEACIESLHDRPSALGLSKYIVLVYADPSDGSRPQRRYSNDYDVYQHSNAQVVMRVIESIGPTQTPNEFVHSRLYKIG